MCVCVCSGLGPCAERAGVCGCEALRSVCVLLSLSPHHLHRLAVLSPPGGHADRCSRPAASPRHTRSQSWEKTPVTTNVVQDGEFTNADPFVTQATPTDSAQHTHYTEPTTVVTWNTTGVWIYSTGVLCYGLMFKNQS